VKYLISIFSFLFIASCTRSAKDLPFIGTHSQDKTGKTTHYSVGDFSFLNQDQQTINAESAKNKVYVADFFFTSCPTICPVMKTQMLRVNEAFKNSSDFLILSHTIDPEHDSFSVLKNYKTRLVGEAPNWHFLRAEKRYTHNLAQKSYFVSALEDKAAIDDGGFVHSGAFVLVDKQKHIRGVYDGTKEEEVTKLIEDINLLIEK
jgi:protein SCO1